MTAFDPKTFRPKPVEVVKPARQLGALRFSPDGKVLAAGGLDALVHRWDATGPKLAPLPPLAGHHGWVQALAFHPDGKRLYTGDSWGRLRCWPFADREPKPLWDVADAHARWLRQLAVSPDGREVATCGADRAVRLWSADAGARAAELAHPADVLAVAFHPDGKTLVTGDQFGTVRSWDAATGKPGRVLEVKELHFVDRMQDVGGVRSLAFDREGKTLAVGGGKPTTGGFVQGTATVVLFDWAAGKPTATLRASGTADVYAHDVHFHPAGFVVAVSSGQPGQGKLYFQRPGDETPFYTGASMGNSHAVAIDPRLTRVAVISTNGDSSGNGRNLNANKEYPGNYSPLHVLELPKVG